MLDSYIEALQRGDAEGVAEAPAPDVVLHVAVHDEPIVGREAARLVFGFLFDGIFSNLSGGEVIGDGPTRAFVFDVDVAELTSPAEGANVVRLNGEGQPEQVAVFLRPLRALNVLTRRMGKRMGGPPPA